MPRAEVFLENYSVGDDFHFGSNTHGIWEEDGSVWYNSYNEEQFYFENIEDFLSFWYDDNKDVPYKYQYYVGERDDIGNIEWNKGCSELLDGIDHNEDGGMVWSAIINKGTIEKIGSADEIVVDGFQIMCIVDEAYREETEDKQMTFYVDGKKVDINKISIKIKECNKGKK